MNRIRGDLSNFGFLIMPAPRVQALCYIPRIELGFEVAFMIDTGASGTCLNGGYALGLQRYMRKDPLQYSLGIGGRCGYYKEQAVLVFTDIIGQRWARQLEICIQQIRKCLWRKPNPVILLTPCLLGRDILSEWEFQYNHQKQHVELIVP
jgi:hypothetical protein